MPLSLELSSVILRSSFDVVLIAVAGRAPCSGARSVRDIIFINNQHMSVHAVGAVVGDVDILHALGRTFFINKWHHQGMVAMPMWCPLRHRNTRRQAGVFSRCLKHNNTHKLNLQGQHARTTHVVKHALFFHHGKYICLYLSLFLVYQGAMKVHAGGMSLSPELSNLMIAVRAVRHILAPARAMRDAASSTTSCQHQQPSCAMTRTWTSSIPCPPQAERYLAEQGVVSIYKLADIYLNAAASGGPVVGDFCIVRVIGRCPSTRSSPPLSNDTAHGGLLCGVYQYTAIQGSLLTCPSSIRRRDAAAHGSLLLGVRRDTTIQGARLSASFIDRRLHGVCGDITIHGARLGALFNNFMSCMSPLVATFYVVSAKTPRYGALVLAHPSQVSAAPGGLLRGVR